MNTPAEIIEVIKETLPKLDYHVDNIFHTVGYTYENDDGTSAYIIQGSGFSELEAWMDAYNWINKIGTYRATDELQMF